MATSKSPILSSPCMHATMGDATAVLEGGGAVETSSYKEADDSNNNSPNPRVLMAAAASLERLVSRNEKCVSGTDWRKPKSPFYGLRSPNISICRYMERIYKYTNCSPSCFVLGYAYIDQLIHKRPDQPLVSLNVHRLLITSIMVATKLLDDVHYNNGYYAQVGGIGNAELNSLEIDFLFRLDFRLQVTSNTFQCYCAHLERELVMSTMQQVERPLSIPTVSLSANEEEEEEEEEEKEDKTLHNAQEKLIQFISQNGPTIAAMLAKENQNHALH